VLTTRPATFADTRAVAALLDATTRLWVGRPTTVAQATDRLNTPGSELERDTVCVRDEAGPLVGFGHIWPGHPDLVRCFARTHPDHRGRGVGTVLQQWVVARAAELAAAPSPDRPRTIDTTTWPGDTEAEVLLTSFGYSPERYFLTMVADLATVDPPAVPDPEGIVVRAFRLGDEDAVYAAYLESFAEHWGTGRPGSAEWWGERRDQASAGFDPDLWLVAEEAGEVAGFVVAREQPDASGVVHGYVGDLGVRPAWRGRRLGEALLTRSLRAFRDRGLPYASLHVDAENTTGAVRLYTKAGMRPQPSFTVWQRPI